MAERLKVRDLFLDTPLSSEYQRGRLGLPHMPVSRRGLNFQAVLYSGSDQSEETEDHLRIGSPCHLQPEDDGGSGNRGCQSFQSSAPPSGQVVSASPCHLCSAPPSLLGTPLHSLPKLQQPCVPPSVCPGLGLTEQCNAVVCSSALTTRSTNVFSYRRTQRCPQPPLPLSSNSSVLCKDGWLTPRVYLMVSTDFCMSMSACKSESGVVCTFHPPYFVFSCLPETYWFS